MAQQDIADIVQDVFGAVAGNLARFRKERPEDTFRGWLATITRNKVRDYFRRRCGEPMAAGGTEAWQRMGQVCAGSDVGSSSDTDSAEFGGVLKQALASIRGEFHERTWQAFWLTVVDGRLAADAAAELGMRPGAIRVAKSRVLSRLRQELGDAPAAEC